MSQNQLQESITKTHPKTLDKTILREAEQYAKSMGIGRFPIHQGKAQAPYFHLVISKPDVIIHAKYSLFGPYEPQGPKEELKEIERKEREEGNHTYLMEIKANAGGYVNRNWIQELATTVGIMYHEGFHLRPRRDNLHTWIEESCAETIRHQGLLSFFKVYGNTQYLNEARKHIASERKLKREYAIQLEERLSQLERKETIPQNHPFNNARLLGYYPYFGNYFLCERVCKKLGTLRGFVELVSGLPKDFDQARNILRAIDND